MPYDMLLSGGRVIDPAQGIDGAYDVAIQDGRVAAVRANIPRSEAQAVLDVSGKLVLPGLIDTHAHVYQYVTGRFGLNADMVGIHSGVTALIDQGGPSCMTSMPQRAKPPSSAWALIPLTRSAFSLAARTVASTSTQSGR